MPSTNYPNQNIESRIPDDLLREWAKGSPAWDRGEISETDQALLCMNLSDLAGELLAFRLRDAARKEMHERNRITQVIRKHLARRDRGACHAN